MMMGHACPPLVLGLLTTFLLFFLPDPGWPRPASPVIIIIIIYLACWWINPSWTSLPNSLTGSTSTAPCDWLSFTKPLDIVVPMMHSWIFACPIPGPVFSFFFLCCALNMLGMFCVRVCSGLMGFRAAPRVRSLHSFPGITVAQVSLWCCVFLSYYIACSCFVCVCARLSSDVYVCVTDWWRGCQTAAAEGSDRRRWWQTSVCPQDGKGKTTVLLDTHTHIFWTHRVLLE